MEDLSNKTLICWAEIYEHIQSIHLQTQKNDAGLIAIIGISRGGLVPAVILSEYKNSYIYSIGIKAQEQIIYQNINKSELNNFKTIYLIDDICDSGRTFKYATKELNNLNYKTIYLLYRPNNIYKPDYYAKEIKKDWIIFPWEMKLTT